MEKINGLRKVIKHPDANNQKVESDFRAVKSRIQSRQKGIYIAFCILTAIHYGATFWLQSRGIYLFIPIIMLFGFFLLILFFYSFKGGRVIPDIEFDIF